MIIFMSKDVSVSSVKLMFGSLDGKYITIVNNDNHVFTSDDYLDNAIGN